MDSEQPMHSLAVGKLYHPDRNEWTTNVEYNYMQGVHELRLFIPNLTTNEIAQVQSAPVQFGMVEVGPTQFLVFQFGTLDAMDCSFSWHLVKHQFPDEPLPLAPLWVLPSPDSRILLQIVLVAAETGVVKALRSVSWSPVFSRRWYDTLHRLAHEPWVGPAAYEVVLQHVYARYPSSEDLMGACLHFCQGGD